MEPKSYRAFYIEPGLADYSSDGIGTVLVQKPALDKINPTYRGMPVVNLEHTDLEADDLFNLTKDSRESGNQVDFADGIVAATGRLEEDYTDAETGKTWPAGWYWADFLIWDGDTQENIEDRGFSVSCAYDVTDAKEGGKYHNVPYDEEVLDGVGLHMAIVPNPRYESAGIILMNSLEDEKPMKFRILKNSGNRRTNMDPPQPPAEDAPDGAAAADDEMNIDDAYVALENGEKMPLRELVNKFQEMQNAEEDGGTEVGPDDEVEVDGEKVKVSDMMNACGIGETKANSAEDDIQTETAEEVVDESKQLQNAARTSKGNEHFRKVKNAASAGGAPYKPTTNTRKDRLARGKSRYGTAVSQGGKK